MMEKWKPIQGYEDKYSVSNKGRVKSHLSDGLILKGDKSNHGHIRVQLYNKGVKRKLVHRLVAKAFIPNPENKPQINHIDSDPANNCVENLEWSTQSENIQHAYNTGRKDKRGEKHHLNKLTKEKVISIRKDYDSGKHLQRELAEKHGVGQDNISRIVNRKLWSHV